MPNVNKVLREEITRLARKEAKASTDVLKRSSAQHRRDIASLKREVATLRKTAGVLARQASRAAPVATPPASGKFRFVAKGFKTLRKRLGISAEQMAELIGVSGLSVYKWESGKARPRAGYLPVIAGLRGLGKREVLARLKTGQKGK